MRFFIRLIFYGGVLFAIGTLVWANLPPDSPLPAGAVADHVVVMKSKRTLELQSKGKVLKRYWISLGSHPVGHKQEEGDGRTPEGLYNIQLHNPHSSYHLSLQISYPSPADKASAQKRKVPPGGEIMIHGLPNKLGLIGRLHRYRDWTAGCVAMTDPEIEEIYRAVPDGTLVEVKP
jgi:murein L,D-transpeptidase YafK